MNYTQENRAMEVTTPLGKDVLLLAGFTGHEAVSRLFNFDLDLIAEKEKEIAFDKLLGQNISIRLNLPGGEKRFFSGICNRFSQGGQDDVFTHYRLEMVPEFWKLTKKAQSRIFQQKSVPDILKKVLEGLDVTYEIQGNFHPRDFCVQYRETDFNFASRVMEEEGIYYFFKHTADGHKMVVANTTMSHSDMPHSNKVIYEEMEGGTREEDRIYEWEKVQEWRSGKCTLWDHCFELPHKHLEAESMIVDSVQVGRVNHKLKVNGNDKFEIYDYPGEYAQRFDGINPGGGDRAADLQKIFEDNRRTTDIRMQQETVPAIVIQGSSNCRHFVTGHKFSLERHFNADGQYMLTSVTHTASQGGAYRSDMMDFSYENRFTCIPFAVSYRPERLTPKPFIQGTQTAVVVGPKGEEIYTDKYSRIKVQFHWDREGKKDENSSCWIRVSTLSAGKQWGMINIPRIDQEVIVDFLEGDPDQPIVIGSVYNAEQMPANDLPAAKVVSGRKTNTHKGKGYNEMSMDDTVGKEKITIHGQYDMSTTVKHDDSQTIQNNRTITVDGTHTETIKKDTTIIVTEGKQVNTVQKEIEVTSKAAHIHQWAETHIELWVGASKLRMESNGDITLHGKNISIIGDVTIKESAPKIDLSGGEEAKLGVGNQNIICDTAQTGISGAAINSSAKGTHEITGAVVKIN